VEHPGHGVIRMTGFPVKLSETPCVIHRPAPDLGADTAAVLAEIGCDAAELERLRASKVVG
jgi:crotonobetainyl-CoA:carnitine CoA-transferase CaiB-like acyl-CoA transferase